MLLVREYRRLPGEALVEIFDRDGHETDFSVLACVIDGFKPEYFTAGLKEGWLKASDIHLNGRPLYRLFWQKRGNGEILHVHASLSLGIGPAEGAVAWGKGADMLASREGCKKLTFVTARKAHIAQAQTWGATVTGVTMEKNYDA